MRKRFVHLPTLLSICLSCLLLLCSGAPAEDVAPEKSRPAIELGAPFTHNAILQRELPVPVWGWSKPGTEITVQFAGQRQKAAASEDGKWMVTLTPLTANATPQKMVIGDSAGRQVTLENVLVGEVWMASGQSNMQWIASKASTRILISELKEKGELPPIRECKVTSVFSSLHPVEHAEGQWSDGSDFGDYSAIAFAFAYELYQELGVPIGILNCAFSTTKIEAWTPRVGFKDGQDEYTQSVYQQTLESDPTTPEHKTAWNDFYQELENTLKENAERIDRGEAPQAVSTRTPGNLNGNRDACWMFNAKINPMIPYAIRGAIWNQGYANMGGGLTYYHNLHSLVRGWRTVWNRPNLPIYFHQFYCPGEVTESLPDLGSTAEMRLGTWLASQDIPNAAMASQIDIRGAVHYGHKTVPGQRLAKHALKNQYGKKIVADGPMFKSYTVEGHRLIVHFDHAESGLVVAETATNTDHRNKEATGLAEPTIIENGEDRVKLFYLADENRVWYPAKVKIDGDNVILSSPEVNSPKGVSYAASGVGGLPNLYNRALLPATPFIYYDQELVTSKNWPEETMQVHGVTVDPGSVGRQYEYRKMPLLSTQFRDHAVLQAGRPITIWGSAIHDWGYEAQGEAVIKFSFAGIEQTIPVVSGMREWQVTVPAMPASAEPKTLKVAFEIDGELVHQRVCENVVFGDVWYVAAPPINVEIGEVHDPSGMVRVMTRKAKRSTSPRPSRYSVCVSTTPKNRFASQWNNAGDKGLGKDGNGLAALIGTRIHAKTKKPVGVVFMQSDDTELKSWIAVDCLKRAPSLMADYKDLAAKIPGTSYYKANVRTYIADWKKYWGQFVPQLMATKKLPDVALAWGTYPTFASSVSSDASQTYHVMVHSFTPASFKGVLFLCGPKMFETEQGANYGSELSALANCWKASFGGDDPQFFYAIPNKSLAPQITRPREIEGHSTAVEIDTWLTAERGDKQGMEAAGRQLLQLVDQVVDEAYK